MFINQETHISGIFKFSPNALYDSGDMVITSQGQLFVCSPKDTTQSISIESEEDLEDDENFYPYLLNKTLTLQDYISDSTEGQYSNKFITEKTLFAILNYYNTGLNGNGVIGGEFTSLSNTKASSNIYDDGNGVIESGNCLYRLMLDPNINNGVFKVSRDLPEIRPYTNNVYNSYTCNYCILRQYSYYQGDLLMRVQELIDHESPLILYRYCPINWSLDKEAPSFLIAYVGPQTYLDKLKNAFELTKVRLMELDEVKENLTNNFRYKKINTNNSNTLTIQNSNKSSAGYIEQELNSTFATINILDERDNINHCYSLTIDISDSRTYNIDLSGDTQLQVSYSSGTSTITVDSGLKITSAYYQQYFKE